jgi:hypothetical protein
MLLNFNVHDQMRRQCFGTARVRLDWGKKTWEIQDDPQAAWSRVSVARTGLFVAEGAAVKLFDGYMRDMAVLFDGPRAAMDLGAQAGKGSVSAAGDRQGAAVTWTQEPGTAQSAAADAALSGRRQRLLARLRELLPCSLDDLTQKDPRTNLPKWDVVSMGCRKFSGTSCGSLPGFVSMFLGADPLKNGRPSGLAAHKAYMGTRSLSGTPAVRTKGLKYGGWVEAGNDRRPKPGDIYALLDRDGQGLPLTDKKNSGIGHVGVILDATGDRWFTADLGQGHGFDGKIDVERAYRKADGMLWGEVKQGGIDPYRVVAGWVDIDEYFKDSPDK